MCGVTWCGNREEAGTILALKPPVGHIDDPQLSHRSGFHHSTRWISLDGAVFGGPRRCGKAPFSPAEAEVCVSVADLHQQIQHKSQKRTNCRLIPSRDQSPINPTLQVITRILWRRGKKAILWAASVSALPIDWCVNTGQCGCLFMRIRSSISEQMKLQTPFIHLQQPPHLYYPTHSFNSASASGLPLFPVVKW